MGIESMSSTEDRYDGWMGGTRAILGGAVLYAELLELVDRFGMNVVGPP